jgi:hypothetical protein
MKAITVLERDMEDRLEVLLQAFVVAWSGTKTAGDYGVIDRPKAEKIAVQRMLGKNRRGKTGKAT